MPEYLIRKELIAFGEDLWVEDEQGERVFHVDGKALRLRKTPSSRLLDAVFAIAIAVCIGAMERGS